MENKFKVSDKVRCVSERGYMWLTKGYTYEIKSCSALDINVINDNNTIFNYPKDCFESKFQEPNYMMVWDTEEKKAEKLEVFADLSDNPRYDNIYPVYVLKNNNTERRLHAKSIEQWKKDTGFLFENSLHERFFAGDVIYWVHKKNNTLHNENTKKDCDQKELKEDKVNSEAMTKESAEKYIKEHKVKYKPFTMEEFKAYRDCWFVNISNKHINVKASSYNDKQVFLKEISLSYAELLECFTFEDGTPCGIKE